ncbi:hypothetical protein BJ165DRAFT_1339087, partial [Panaeolus papilionaceus]
WTLARIRWWGGWAQGEHRDTLIKYLLDELYTYEGDHSDVLNPFDKAAATAGGPSQALQRVNDLQGEVNPVCSLELRSRLEGIQKQNDVALRKMEDQYGLLAR